MPVAKKFRLAALATAVCVATTSVASAEQTQTSATAQVTPVKLIEDVGGTDRINYSGKLRMLSQRIPAAACNLHANVAPEEAKKILAGATAEFEKIIYALEHGDPTLNVIGPEPRRKTLMAIEGVKKVWEPIDAAAHHILDEGSTESLIQQLADENGPLLEAAKLLVSELTGQYSDPAALLQADAIRIDIAGRQRMLSQRISKDACMAMSGINVQHSMDSLGKAIGMFDVSLTALVDGMPAAGIKASTNPDIVAGLEIVQADWAAVQEGLSAVQAGAALDEQARGDLFKKLNTLLVDMNKVVQMYAAVGKQQI